MSVHPTPETTYSPPSLSVSRQLAAGLLYATGGTALLSRLTAVSGPRIRVVNYHQTLPANAATFESHLRFYLRHHAPAGPDSLAALFAGTFPPSRPGMLLTFDDGLKSNYDVAAPLLEKYGFRGYFLVAVGLTECPAIQQRQYAADHRLPGGLLEAPAQDGRIAMSWEELADLCRRGHAVGCHTISHRRLGDRVTDDELKHEVADARHLMTERLGHDVDSFCWVGGEDDAYSARAARLVAEAGYRYAFMTCAGWTTPSTSPLNIHRTNVEDRFACAVAAMQVSGIPDLRSRSRRDHIDALTAVR